MKLKMLLQVSGLALILIVCVTVVNFALTSFFGFREYYFPAKYRKLVFEEAQKKAFNPFLIAGLIYTESHFGPKKTSKAHEVGLMQIRPVVLDEFARIHLIKKNAYTRDDLFNPRINVTLGVAYMHYLKQRIVASKEREEKITNWYEGDTTPTMLFAYNAGPTFVLKHCLDEAKDRKEFEEMIQTKRPMTWQYAKDVLKIQQRLEWFDACISYY